jgi:hypothetical protein
MACHPVLSLASSRDWLAWWLATVQVNHPFSKLSSCMAQHASACCPPHLVPHTFACHAKWFCRNLHAIITMLRTEASHDPTAIPLPDDLDLPSGVSPLRFPDWLSLAFHALKLCAPSLHPLQVLFPACFFDLHDLASGWQIDVDSQEFLLPAGFLRLIARAGAALGPPCYQLPPDVARCLLFEATYSEHLCLHLPSTVCNCCRFRRL